MSAASAVMTADAAGWQGAYQVAPTPTQAAIVARVLTECRQHGLKLPASVPIVWWAVAYPARGCTVVTRGGTPAVWLNVRLPPDQLPDLVRHELCHVAQVVVGADRTQTRDQLEAEACRVAAILARPAPARTAAPARPAATSTRSAAAPRQFVARPGECLHQGQLGGYIVPPRPAAPGWRTS